MKKIVYIGNNLKSTNPTTSKQLTKLLEELSFEVHGYSHQKIKIVRLIHMCCGVVKHWNASIVLIDTYSTCNFYYALVISQLARLLHIPYIPILHGGNLPKRLQRNPRLCRLLFSHAKLNSAPSQYLTAIFTKQHFNTLFIPNAIDLHKYPFKKRTQLQPRLLWVRAFDKIYNPLLALEVLRVLRATNPLATLCMIGPDKDSSMQAIQKKAVQLGLSDALEITGFLSKEAWITKSKEFDVFINTTTIDNIPVSVIEAMALGLPVVSTNVGGMPYLINSYKNGILVADNDAMQMVSAIEELIKEPALVTEITTEAKKRVAVFDSTSVKQQWNNLLNS